MQVGSMRSNLTGPFAETASYSTLVGPSASTALLNQWYSLGPSRYTALVQSLDKWARPIWRAAGCMSTQNTYRAAIGGSSPRLATDFGESSMETVPCSPTVKRHEALRNHGGCATRALKSLCAHVVGAAGLDGISQPALPFQHTLSIIDQHLCPLSTLQVFEPRYSYAIGTLWPLIVTNYRKNRIDLHVLSPEELDKMEELEELFEEYNNVNDQLANDPEVLEGPMVSTEDLEKVKQEKKALRQYASPFLTVTWHDADRQDGFTATAEHEQEIASQATKIDALEQALFYLSGDIAGGQHVLPTTRILCVAENPGQAWVDLRQATMDRIRGENEARIEQH
ncbi:hypothetical protein BKA70DRAFT_1439345 [Coprinopsis sp. MPI-PUGE-AT-0042]|nr:hypothetical protein BKA70DRAFT_1439345 [Coprinopsis sp. MPI-PUGE-AT-0042]